MFSYSLWQRTTEVRENGLWTQKVLVLFKPCPALHPTLAWKHPFSCFTVSGTLVPAIYLHTQTALPYFKSLIIFCLCFKPDANFQQNYFYLCTCYINILFFWRQRKWPAICYHKARQALLFISLLHSFLVGPRKFWKSNYNSVPKVVFRFIILVSFTYPNVGNFVQTVACCSFTKSSNTELE